MDYGLDSSGSSQRSVFGALKEGTEFSGFHKMLIRYWEFPELLRNCWFLKKHLAHWS